MLFRDTYHMIEAPVTGEFKDRGSRFIGFAYPVKTEDEVKQVMQQLKKDHFAAAHHCYAYILGNNSEIQKSNDDREPANTAGKPILRSILAKDLTNILVVVVRYFGGKLLGVPGLIHAYGEAANVALGNARITEKVSVETHRLSFAYEHENEAFRILKQYQLKVLQHHHAEKITLVFEVRRSLAEKVLQAIAEKRIFDTEFISAH